MALALPHVRRPTKNLARVAAGTSHTVDNDNKSKSTLHGALAGQTVHCCYHWSVRSVIIVVIGVILLLFTVVTRQSRPIGDANGAVLKSKAIANHGGSADKPPIGSASFVDGSLCTPESRCRLLHPAAEISDHVPDEAVDRTIRIKLVRRQGSLFTYNDDATTSAAALTRRGAGIGHDINQDRSFILQLPGTDFIVGIFDGHGEQGHVTSHYVSSHLPSILTGAIANKADSDEVAIKQILTDAFLRVDSEVDSAGDPLDMSNSGSTAIVVLRRGKRLYVANSGDSLAFIVSRDKSTGNTEITYRTKHHKPDMPEERARVEGAGGQVYEPPAWAVGDSPRVLSPLTEEEESLGTLPFGLAMSRSIGDRELKGVGVIADPTVDVVDIDSLIDTKKGNADVFVVCATDGLFDHVGPEELANRLGKALYHQESTTQKTLLSTMEEIVMEASKVWLELMGGEVYRDDITLAVAKMV